MVFHKLSLGCSLAVSGSAFLGFTALAPTLAKMPDHDSDDSASDVSNSIALGGAGSDRRRLEVTAGCGLGDRGLGSRCKLVASGGFEGTFLDVDGGGWLGDLRFAVGGGLGRRRLEARGDLDIGVDCWLAP